MSVELWPWRVLLAVAGRVSVTRRWSVLPAVIELMFDNAVLAPMTAVVARTEVVVPPQMYVYGGPDSVQATEHLSITIWSPFVVSVSSNEEGDAVVVSVTDPTLLVPADPLLVMSTARWIVSPGTRFEAPTVSRFVVPSVIETVPEVRLCACALVELVKLANVARLATPAAAPRIATLTTTLM